ncbi:MAG: hypothetical protein K2I82_02680, partial [Ruminococcus sp.]|nr:hypothetical protein [Ruminococcus sp.]
DLKTLKQLRQKLREEDSSGTNRMSIGIFNIYKRIHTMYKDGKMRIHSKAGVGTIIKIYIADERGNHIGE